jgi:tRNA A37 threonylcarbamoyladenosine dehydratase
MSVFNCDELLRYSRQLLHDEVGIGGQEKLKNAKVLVVGAGGLGPILQYLGAAGAKTVGTVDFDTVEIHNLHRQILVEVPMPVNRKQMLLQKKYISRIRIYVVLFLRKIAGDQCRIHYFTI